MLINKQNIFSEENIQLIIECLLYSSCLDVDMHQYKEEFEKMQYLAIQLRLAYPLIPVKNTFCVESQEFSDENTENLLQIFPELTLN